MVSIKLSAAMVRSHRLFIQPPIPEGLKDLGLCYLWSTVEANSAFTFPKAG